MNSCSAETKNISSRFGDFFLEKPEQSVFYSSVLGGLSDNVMTIGKFAGTFVSCSSCGDTSSVKGGWTCKTCGEASELKAERAKVRKGDVPVDGELFFRIKGMSKPGILKPHWYYSDENWAVADFVTQLLRLEPEKFLPGWIRSLGFPLPEDVVLEELLTWPRLVFADACRSDKKKTTIQPDVVIVFSKAVFLFEFKRPKGAVLPAVEVAGQLAFSQLVADKLNLPVYNGFIPGPERSSSLLSLDTVVKIARDGQAVAQKKWDYLDTLVQGVQKNQTLSERIGVLSWEKFLALTLKAIRQMPETWSRKQVQRNLEHFHLVRTKAHAGAFVDVLPQV